jgi:hypothetical protein
MNVYVLEKLSILFHFWMTWSKNYTENKMSLFNALPSQIQENQNINETKLEQKIQLFLTKLELEKKLIPVLFYFTPSMPDYNYVQLMIVLKVFQE